MVAALAVRLAEVKPTAPRPFQQHLCAKLSLCDMMFARRGGNNSDIIPSASGTSSRSHLNVHRIAPARARRKCRLEHSSMQTVAERFDSDPWSSGAQHSDALPHPSASESQRSPSAHGDPWPDRAHQR